MISSIGALAKKIYDLVWLRDFADDSSWWRAFIIGIRVFWAVVRDLTGGRLALHAMSLVYTTLLSLVPVLALSFAILKAFKVHTQLESAMQEFLAPLGDQGTEIIAKVMEFVQNVDINLLGSIGFGFLLYTFVSMIQKIEYAFNGIWQVHAQRSLLRRFTEFLSVGLLGPLLIFTALGIMANAIGAVAIEGLTDSALLRSIIEQFNRLVPYGIVITGFALLYLAIPNTQVNLSSALVGGTVAGIIWGAIGWTFAVFVVSSARYAAVYSAFASLVLFMIWLYVAWLILLIGCAVAFYFQNRAYLSPHTGIVQLTPVERDRLAIYALVLLHEAFKKGQTPWTERSLGQRLHIPAGAMSNLIEKLETAKMVSRSADRPARLIPNKPADLVSTRDVLRAMTEWPADDAGTRLSPARHPAVSSLFVALDAARMGVLDGMTIADLIDHSEEK